MPGAHLVTVRNGQEIGSEARGRAGRIEIEIQRTIWEYGKVGLVVDDRADARVRIARELYGADDLPRWWRAVHSIDCLGRALEIVIRMLEDPQGSHFYGMAVLDRYLPPSCGPEDRQPKPWDGKGGDGQDLSPAMTRVWSQVERLGQGFDQHEDGRVLDEQRFKLFFVTSFPHSLPSTEPAETPRKRILWKLRSLELLRDFRAKIDSHHQWSRLLWYGPEPDAPVVTATPPGGLLLEPEQARWRAVSWRSCLENLVRNCWRPGSQRPSVVLLTGAGASLRQGPYGAGMPATWELLERACQAVAPRSENPSPVGRSAEVCLCSKASLDAAASPGNRSFEYDRETMLEKPPLRWLLEHWQQGGRAGLQRLVWQWTDLFDWSLNQQDGRRWTDFFRAFVAALYRHDHGFPFHSWLLARLPWSTIITTNFDGFHERAAAAAAQIPWLDDDRRRRYLSFASDAAPLLHAWHEASMSVDSPQPGEDPALLKTYGNLCSSRGHLFFSPEDLDAAQKSFSRILDDVISEHGRLGSLVVLGHGMRDRYLDTALAVHSKTLRRTQLLWVDPAAFSRVQRAPKSWWEIEMDRRRRQRLPYLSESPIADHPPEHWSGPLPGSALEFASDLWRAFQAG
jgi:hypothetical protein